MKINLPAVLVIFAGVILIYSAYHKVDPRNVILEAIGSNRRIDGIWGSIAGAVEGGAKAGAGAITKPHPDMPGYKPPTSHGPVVSV